uniref:Uncharacterized protein n=1 Tax=viral metagenome TaxID=1070528 RepID=A0A6M3JLD9_9ZZZZ
MRTFVIRKIPDHIWKSVKIRVAQEGITLNEAMLILVRAYAEDKGGHNDREYAKYHTLLVP